MAVFNEPTQWSHTLGNNADVSTLPDDTGATTGVASLQKLFQVINQTPLEAGGVAPEREDINALYKILGDYIFFLQNGGVPAYNNTYDYVIGRMVLYTDGNIYKCIQANGASSTVVAPDSVSPLGSDYWVQVATLADFANFANTDLSNLSASGQALFTNKADKEFSNVTAPVQAFKDMSIGWLMPDYDSAIDITALVTSTNTSITIDKDSYIQCISKHNSANYTVQIYLDDILIIGRLSHSSGQAIYNVDNSFVIKAGVHTIRGNIEASQCTIKVIPCKGA